MKKLALLLPILTLTAYAKEFENPMAVFDTLIVPDSETKNTTSIDPFRSRANIPAGEYEILADLCQLPDFLKSIGFSAEIAPLESASLACSEGNIALLAQYAPVLFMFTGYNNQLEQMEYYTRDLDPDSAEGMWKLAEKRIGNRRSEITTKLAALPPLHIKPVYLSCRFVHPQAKGLLDLATAETPPSMKRVNFEGVLGFEFDSSKLPQSMQELLAAKLQVPLTIYFYPVNEHEFTIVLASGTEGIEKLMRDGEKMRSTPTTAPLQLGAQLWIDEKAMRSISAMDLSTFRASLMYTDPFSDDLEHGVDEYYDKQSTLAIQAMLPQFTSDLDLQIWSQDGDVCGKLSVHTSNYPLDSAPVLAQQLINDKNTDFYLNISSMAIDENQFFAMEFIKYTMCAYLKMMSGESGNIIDEQFITRAENLRKVTEKMIPTLTGNFAFYAKYDAPTDPEYPAWRRQRACVMAGVKDKQNLVIVFEQIVEAIIKMTKMDDVIREEFWEQTKQYADLDRAGDDNFYFKEGEGFVVFGDSAEMAKQLSATQQGQEMDGIIFLMRGDSLKNRLPHSLHERVDGVYLRVVPAGEKKDLYFKADFKGTSIN